MTRRNMESQNCSLGRQYINDLTSNFVMNQSETLQSLRAAGSSIHMVVQTWLSLVHRSIPRFGYHQSTGIRWIVTASKRSQTRLLSLNGRLGKRLVSVAVTRPKRMDWLDTFLSVQQHDSVDPINSHRESTSMRILHRIASVSKSNGTLPSLMSPINTI